MIIKSASNDKANLVAGREKDKRTRNDTSGQFLDYVYLSLKLV